MANDNSNKYPDKSYSDLEALLMESKNRQTTAQEQTDVLNKASQEAYAQTQLENQQAQNQFAQNTAANQLTALDAIRRSNASAIANGANAGLSAANQLSSILGLQDATAQEATQLANADVEAAAKLNTQLAENAVAGQKAANDINVAEGANQAEIAKALAELNKALAQRDSQVSSTEAQKDANDKALESANKEADYKRLVDSLDNMFNSWQGGDAHTYAKKYYDPRTDTIKTTDDEKTRKAEMQQMANYIKQGLASAYSSNDTEQVKLWTNKYNQFIKNLEYTNDACLMPGTLISMADGTFKRVEDVQAGDLVRVWDHEQSTSSARPVLFNEHSEASLHTVIHLEFADSSSVDFVSDHGFFDLTTMQYEYIKTLEDAQALIGHYFVKDNKEFLYNVKLVRASVAEKVTTTHSPCTAETLNIFANGFLTMPGATEPFTNLFPVDLKNLGYNKREFKKRLKKYGKTDYTEFADLIPANIFYAFQGPYLNISMALGKTNKEDLTALIEKYKNYLI